MKTAQTAIKARILKYNSALGDFSFSLKVELSDIPRTSNATWYCILSLPNNNIFISELIVQDLRPHSLRTAQ